MTLPGPAFQEYTGSCHENVPSLNVINRWSDCIGQDRDSHHLVHYQPLTYNTSHTQ